MKYAIQTEIVRDNRNKRMWFCCNESGKEDDWFVVYYHDETMGKPKNMEKQNRELNQSIYYFSIADRDRGQVMVSHTSKKFWKSELFLLGL